MHSDSLFNAFARSFEARGQTDLSMAEPRRRRVNMHVSYCFEFCLDYADATLTESSIQPTFKRRVKRLLACSENGPLVSSG
jgi:hypothetical protein